MTAPSHAADEEEEMTWTEMLGRLRPDSADWPGGEPPDLSGEEPPPWLDEDYLDPDDESMSDPGEDFIVLAARAEADGIADRKHRLRLLTNGVGTGYAHSRSDSPVPGPHSGPGGGFKQGGPLDLAAPGPRIAGAAEEAAGSARVFTGVGDDELLGLISAHRKLIAHHDWERLMAIGELVRRRPAAGCKLEGEARLPKVWLEGAARELANQLAVTNREAHTLLGLAIDLLTRLPLTSAALRDGILDYDKTQTIANRCTHLTDEEAAEAEALLFADPDVEDMTWSMINDRIRLAAMQVNPEAAVRHRKAAEKDCRVIVKPEASGNHALSGRELPSAAALQMDQAIKARARELRKLGVEGSMNRLRTLALLEPWNVIDPLTSTYGADDDRLDPADEDPTADEDQTAGNDQAAGKDQTPGKDQTAGKGQTPGDAHGANDGQDGDGPKPGPAGDGGGCTCGRRGITGLGNSGVAGWLHLTAPLLTLQNSAERPGWLHGAGPADPTQVRDLADQLLRNNKSTICLTAVDKDGRPAAHACGKPGPGDRTRRRRHQPDKQDGQGVLYDGTGPPERKAALVQTDTGPPGILGTWRLTVADREILFTFEDLAGPCDHKHQAAGHDPGRLLDHLTRVLNQECTFLTCRTPNRSCEYEHSKAHHKGGITCLCACGPVCKRNHLDKQQRGWKIEPGPARGWFTWTLPSGRTYRSKPTVYPA